VAIGDPLDEHTLMGPLISAQAVRDYREGITEIRRQGGRLLLNGRRLVLHGASLQEDAPGRGDALKGLSTGRDAIAMTRDFVTSLYGAAETSVARGRNLKESMAATREVMDPKFSSFAIYEHCLPFNVSRAYDEASGIDDPVIWTDKRDQEMWAALQGGG